MRAARSLMGETAAVEAGHRMQIARLEAALAAAQERSGSESGSMHAALVDAKAAILSKSRTIADLTARLEALKTADAE